MLDQIVAHFGWLHIGCSGQYAFKIAKFLNQLGCGFWSNAGHAGDIVDTVAHQSEHIADLVRTDTEFLEYFF